VFRSRSLLAVVALVAAALVFAASASAAPKVAGEFTIPSGVGSNNDIVQGPDGNMWVTLEGNVGDDGIARITPAGQVKEFVLPNDSYGIAAGPDGNLWVSTAIGVIKVPPANPANFTPYDVGLSGGRGIVAGPDGNMWVAGDGELISFDPAAPENTDNPTAIAGLQPHGMTVGSDGLLWIASGDGFVYSATAAPAPTVTPYDARINNAGGVQDVAAGPNGQVAYAAPQTDPQTVGRITPGGTPQKTELVASDPFGVAFAPDGAYWIARFLGNDLLRLTPQGATTTLNGFSANSGPRKIATGPNGTLWVTLDTAEKVARVTGVTAKPPEPTTTLVKTPKRKLVARDRRNGRPGRASAKFAFTSNRPAATFECSLRPRGKNPRFKSCESPAKYRLKPGRYEFQVRAVLAGQRDRTPATYGFKVVRKRR
jgi:streptogramin lyase